MMNVREATSVNYIDRTRDIRGVALVAVMISILVLSGVVAIYVFITGDASKIGQGRSEQMSLESFARAVLYICPDYINGINNFGDYADKDFPDMIAHSKINFSLDITDFTIIQKRMRGAARIDGDFSGGQGFQPELEVLHGGLRGFLDIDKIISDAIDGASVSEDVEFSQGGVAGGSNTNPPMFYRCTVRAYDDGAEFVLIGNLVQ